MTVDTAFGPVASHGMTHTGRVRRENQDALLLRPDLGLWAVADGMGGHADGALASRSVVESLNTIAPTGPRDLLVEVGRCLAETNTQLIAAAQDRGVDVIASTVVVLLVHGRHYACAWAGDSRMYLCRNGAMAQVTRDHSQVQELIDSGLLTAEAARHHPANNMVTRAVGANAQIEIEMTHDEIRPGDTFLLCSDGLTKTTSDEEIVRILTDGPVESAVQTLIEGALNRGAPDNVTVVIVRCAEEPRASK